MSFHNHAQTGGLRIFSAPCGAGKTTRVINHIANNLLLKNWLYVGPTIRLLKQMEAGLRQRDVLCTIISSETDPKSVGSKIVTFLKSAPNNGTVLLITWHAYERLPYFHRRDDWQIFIDEVPQVDRAFPLMLPNNPEFIRDNLEIDRLVTADIGCVRAKNDNWADKWKEGVRDDVDQVFRPVFEHILSPHHDVFVRIDDWQRLMEDGAFEVSEARNVLMFVSMLNPILFRDAILIGANIEDSLLHDWLKRFHRVDVQPWASYELNTACGGVLAGGMSPPPSNEIWYFFDDRAASKHLYGQRLDGKESIIDQMDREVLSQFGGSEFLYITNNDRSSEIITRDNPKAIFVSPKCHGLNDYRTVDRVYFSAALNRTPQHNKLLNDLGFSFAALQRATAQEDAYQAVMRTSLRDRDSTRPVQIVVPDRATADRLAHLIGSCEVSKIGNIELSKLPPLTRTEKSRNQSARKLKKILVSSNLIPKSIVKDNGTEIEDSYRGSNSLNICVTLHEHAKPWLPDHLVCQTFQLRKFIDFLSTCSKEVRSKKTEQPLLCPSTFDLSRNRRVIKGHDNVVSSSFLVLDFDDGRLSPETFIDLFWPKDRPYDRIPFLLHNSFSRSHDEPNRFRALSVYREPAHNVEEHQACYDLVESRLRAAGFDPKESGLDRSCRSPAQSFYLPMTNSAQKGWYLFERRGLTTKEIRRYALCPGELLALSRSETSGPGEGKRPNPREPRDDEVSECTAMLRSMTEGRHEVQFQTGIKLRSLGCSFQRIEAELAMAMGGGTLARKKAKDTVKSIQRYALRVSRQRS